MQDPRQSLTPGVYRATVTAVTESSLEYALPDCGEWRWSLYRREVPETFWNRAVTHRWFEMEILPAGMTLTAG